MKNNTTFLFIVFLFSLTFSFGQNKMIVNTVNRHLVEQLEKIPFGQEKLYGFESRNDFLLCKSGEPIQVLTLNENNNLVKQNIWRVPIILNGAFKILFTVNIINNHFEIVDIGGVALAKEIQSHKNKKHLFLLRLYNKHLDLIANTESVENIDALLFEPLAGTDLFVEKATNGQLKQKFTIDEIKAIIK